ncbi:MAG TPA: molybdate ABC transporter substrate-binding protein [Desulfuromonadaceae bacterium]
MFIVLIMTAALVTSSEAAEIKVAVPMSIRDAFNELSNTYHRKTAGGRIIPYFSTLQSLALMLESGASVDLLISDHRGWIDYLNSRKILEELFTTSFTSNTLVLVAKPDKRANGIKELLNLKKIAVSDPATQSCGQYTMEAFKNAGIEKQIHDKLVLFKTNHDALMAAERGEVDGAIIYRTDAVHAKTCRLLFSVLPTLYSPVTYQLSLTKTGMKNREAVNFHKFLMGEESKTVLEKYGFITK